MFKLRIQLTRMGDNYVALLFINDAMMIFENRDRLECFKMASSIAWRILKWPEKR